MRGLCLLLAGLCLTLAGGEPAKSQRSFLLGLVGLKPGKLVARPQTVVILQPRPVHTVTQPVYRPAPTRPVYKPIDKPVYKPVHKPVYPAPVQPVYPAPVQPVYPAPVQPVYPAPVQPVHPGPVQPVHPGPVQPVHPGPVQPGPGRGLLLSWQIPQLAGRQFNWQQADSECRRRGLRLVSIEDHGKHLTIRNLLASHRRDFIWTSGQLTSSGWIWSSSGRPVVYTNWGHGDGGRRQPDNRESNEVCLAVLNNIYPGDGIKWHDIACHHLKDFICE